MQKLKDRFLYDIGLILAICSYPFLWVSGLIIKLIFRNGRN